MIFDRSNLKALAKAIAVGIDDATHAANPDRFSWRVKPSDLGDECVARLWFNFRWATLQVNEPRMKRLFSRGHKAEAGLTDYLRAAGWEIREYSKRLIFADERGGGDGQYHLLDWEAEVPSDVIDCSEDPTHIAIALARKVKLKQWRVKDFNGHLSGYLDGKARHPEFTAGMWVNLEFKTYNAKRFVAVTNETKTIQLLDAKYYGQACLYMKYEDFPATVFVAVCKNDDALYIEIIPRDDQMADELFQKADTVINSRARPARISENPAHHVCKRCHHREVCHYDGEPAKNCRTCAHSKPTEKGNFYCNKWEGVIPSEPVDESGVTIHTGCFEHSPLF